MAVFRAYQVQYIDRLPGKASPRQRTHQTLASRSHCRNDVPGGDAVTVEQLVGRPAAGNLAHGESAHSKPVRSNRLRDGVANPTACVMVLDGDHPPLRVARAAHERGRIDRLQRIEIDDADIDALLLELIVRFERVEPRDAGRDGGRDVRTALTQHLQSPDLERLVGPVDHRCLGP